MVENNPYAAPSSNIEQTLSSGEIRLRNVPQRYNTGRGWEWIVRGFDYFKRSPVGWILGMIVGFVVILLLQFIPVIGPILYMLFVYVVVGGVMLGCHAQSQGQPFEVRHVFSAFSKPGKLMLLSVIVLILTLIVFGLLLGSAYFKMMANPQDLDAAMSVFDDSSSMVLKILFALLLMIPLSMAVCFAPALIAIHDMPVIDAMKRSFNGCLKNIMPFLVFGFVGLVLCILAIIPLGLGLLIFFPTFTAASYIAYRDIFTEEV